MKKSILVATLLTIIIPQLLGQTFPAKLKTGEVINLYSGNAPGSENWKQPEDTTDIQGHKVVFNVSEPSMEVYLPENSKATGAAMLVCPGGGFAMLSIDVEGKMVAERLASEGITAFVLKYRTTQMTKEDGSRITNPIELFQSMLGLMAQAKIKVAALNGGKEGLTIDWCRVLDVTPMAFADADKAMTIIRTNTQKWGLNPDKIGIMGFSAGSVITLHQIQNHTTDSRPDFAGVIYGGWGNDFKVPEDACALFMCSPTNDIFSTEESMNVFTGYKSLKKPVDLHYFNDCDHGFGAQTTGKSVDAWLTLMLNFMKDNNF